MEGEKEGFPVTAMREIKLLQSLQHVNVVRLFEMMVSQGSSLCFSLLGSLFSSRLFLSVLAVPLSIS
jgi:serine/threonine protein kinase